jgi:hypothetical protein
MMMMMAAATGPSMLVPFMASRRFVATRSLEVDVASRGLILHDEKPYRVPASFATSL